MAVLSIIGLRAQDIMTPPRFNRKLELATERCALRPTQTKDINHLITAMSYDDVLRYYLFHGGITRTHFKNSLAYWPNKLRVHLFLKIINMKKYAHVWTITEKESQQTIGFVGLHKLYSNVNNNLRAAYRNNYNFTCVLNPQWRAQGISTEVISQFMAAIFNHKKFKKCTGITLLINCENTKALQILSNRDAEGLKYGLIDQGCFTYRYSPRFFMRGFTVSRESISEQALKHYNKQEQNQ